MTGPTTPAAAEEPVARHFVPPAASSRPALWTSTPWSARRALADAGTLSLLDVFDLPRIDALQRHFLDRYWRDVTDRPATGPRRVGDLRNLVVVEIEGPVNDPAVYANPLLLPLMRRLLGDDCILGQFGVTSLPGAADQRPHRDQPWLFDVP